MYSVWLKVNRIVAKCMQQLKTVPTARQLFLHYCLNFGQLWFFVFSNFSLQPQ